MKKLLSIKLLCCMALTFALLCGCGADNSPSSSDAVRGEQPATSAASPSASGQPATPTPAPEPTPTPLPKGPIIATDELLLERFDWENPEHTEGRSTSKEEPRIKMTVRVTDPAGKPVPLLSCDYSSERMWTDSKGEVHFEVLYEDPQMLSLVNGKSGLNIADNPDYWVNYRLTILEGAKAPVLELIWEGVTPQQTIDTAVDRIEITVVDKTGKPVKGAKLWIQEALKEGEQRPDIGPAPELTDENGIFIWCNRSIGDYSISCQVNGEYNSLRFSYTGGVLTKTLQV